MNKKQTFRIWTVLRVVAAIALISWGGWSIYQSTRPTDTSKQPTGAVIPTAGEPTKKSDDQKASYTVPADHPRQLIIERLGINANILPMSTTNDGAMEAPQSAWDVGWYAKSALPGSNNGSLIIDGHVNDTLGKPGIFASIGTLQNGDVITVEKGDLQRISYTVTSVSQQPVNKVDMNALAKAPEGANEGVTLITCSGIYDQGKQTYTDRTIVRATKNT